MDQTKPPVYPVNEERLQRILQRLGWQDRRTELLPGRNWNPIRISQEQVVVYSRVLELLPDDAAVEVFRLTEIGNRSFYGRLGIGLLLAAAGVLPAALAGSPVPQWASMLALGTLGIGIFLSTRISTFAWALEPACREFLRRGGDALALLRGLPLSYQVAYGGLPKQANRMLGAYLIALARAQGTDPRTLFEQAFPKQAR